jgi:F-type H+-transporting ATPase subunit delta
VKDKGYIKRIAGQLIEVAKEGNRFSQIEKDMSSAIELLKNRRVERLLAHPALAGEEKILLLKEAFRAHPISKEVLSVIYLLIEDGTLPLLREIMDEYRRLSYEAQGLKEVLVTTAIAIDNETKERLRSSFEEITGSKVVLNVSVNPKIVGGMVARIGDKVIDGSILTMLSRMREELAR